MKQQFFVGDVVKLNRLGVEVGNRAIQDANHDLWNSKYLLMLKQQGTAVVSKPATILDNQVWLEDNAFFVTPEHLKVVERAWQKNVGKQPVDDGVFVEYKQRDMVWQAELAGDLIWTISNILPITEWRIADSVCSSEDQPEGVPPSHVVLGEELAAVDAIHTSVSTEQDKKHSHYFKKCGYDYVDVYRILKMFDVTDPCISHACKKLLVTGGRGFKDIDHDIQDVIDTLVRWQEMRKEDDEQAR